MILRKDHENRLCEIETSVITVRFYAAPSFFLAEQGAEVEISGSWKDGWFCGNHNGIQTQLQYQPMDDHLRIAVRVENCRREVFRGVIGLHMGVDSNMKTYPQWHEPFFPTLLRCEKTHMWGYYMNSAENALAIASSEPVASYDIRYNRLADGDFGHRICGTDLLLLQDGKLPERHPQNLDSLAPGAVYENTLYLIPVATKEEICPSISRIAGIPMVQSEKYTLEKGETLRFEALGSIASTQLYLPDGSVTENLAAPLEQYGLYRLKLTAENGKTCEAAYFCRPDWDFYLKNAAKEALAKPQKATTHVESFYGYFSAFLAAKKYGDRELLDQALRSAQEVLPRMFDFDTYTPIVIPERIQNTALLISLLVDMFEATQDAKYLRHAAGFADWLIDTKQGSDGVYRSHGRIHYTCVIYIAKAVLELALAEKAQGLSSYERHYASVRRAVEDLVASLDNIETEGESTLEDGMISCSALQIGMFALTLPKEERQPYIDAAEKLMTIHACLEQQLIPDCRCNGASLRYWESQYDVMVMGNMLNSPHGWSAWTAYAHYYLYLLTGKKNYLLSLMNCLGSCAQLMDLNGNLRWGYCAQPHVKARSLVADPQRPLTHGGYRGKYEEKTYGECYIPMISDWYRLDKEQLVGGYEWCPLFLEDQTLYVDNQGGCCDNDVHEIFKCMEETVLDKAFVHENADGSFLTFGCTAYRENGKLIVQPLGDKEILYVLQERDER